MNTLLHTGNRVLGYQVSQAQPVRQLSQNTKPGYGLIPDIFFKQSSNWLAATCIYIKKCYLKHLAFLHFLGQQLKAGEAVGIDGKMFSVSQVEELQQELSAYQLKIHLCDDPFSVLWEDRPALPYTPASIYDMEYAGQSSKDKIEAVRMKLKDQGLSALLLSTLDEIAWLLNLRGDDVHCNPVVISYLLITQEEATFFVAPTKITEEVKRYLQEQGISLGNYNQVEDYLNQFKGENILIDPQKTNFAIYSAINPTCNVKRGISPVALLKAVRNEKEIEGIHAAMKRDGIAFGYVS